MQLPSRLLALAEEHPCFSGVWKEDSVADCVIDPGMPARRVIVLQCQDCLTHRLGTDTSLLPRNATRRVVADELTAHLRRHRGYSLSVGGYHTAGGGFWLSAAYWAQLGVFVVEARNAVPIDALIEGIRTGVVPATDPRMSHPGSYTLHDLYLSVIPPPTAVSLQALLASPHVSGNAQAGFRRVTLAAFNPIARARPAMRVSVASKRPSTPVARPRRRRLGDVCPECGEPIRERPLLNTTFIGCLCG